MRPFLFDEPLLPEGFVFPRRYIEIARNNSWPYVEPWEFLALDKAASLYYFGAMLRKFPETVLIPFAAIPKQASPWNSDDYPVLACFDASESGEPRIIIYDYLHAKNSPWAKFNSINFDEWLKKTQSLWRKAFSAFNKNSGPVKAFLYNESLLPSGFEFPKKYTEFAQDNSWPDFEPWEFLALDKAHSLQEFGHMLKNYPGTKLIPFSVIDDPTGLFNDGYPVLACFDAEELKNPRVRIYAYEHPKSTPWNNFSYQNFDEWFVSAKKESDQFKSDKAEAEFDG